MLRSIRQISQQLKYVSKSSGTASMPSQRVTSVMQARTYKDFGHKEPKEPLISKCYYAFVTFSIIGLMLNWDALLFADPDKELDDRVLANVINTNTKLNNMQI